MAEEVQTIPVAPGQEGMAEATKAFDGLLSGKAPEKFEQEKPVKNRSRAKAAPAVVEAKEIPEPVEEPKGDPDPDDTESDGADVKQEESHPVPQVLPPRSMTDADREQFAKLPPDIQQWLVEREKHVERGGEKVTRKATEAEKTYKAKEAEIATQLQQLAQRASLYRHPDIVAFERDFGKDSQRNAENDPLGYLLARDKAAKAFQEEQAMQAQFMEKQQEALNNYRKEQNERLRDLIPTVKGDKDWEQFDRDITNYVISQATTRGGYEQEAAVQALRGAPAWALEMAHKAMLYDKSVAKLKEATTTAKPTAPTLKSGAVEQRRNGKDEAIAADMKRLQKSGRVEDAARIFGRMLG